LVCEDEKKNHFVFVVPATSELDLKKAAKTTGSKAINLIKQKDLLPLTGYVHGGCSPIGMKKSFPVYIEQKALELDKMCVSAGRPGFQVELSPKDLAKICKGLFASFAA
jgi:Cys-tRNA(Pro)/Cys-tRNA(Cys) deacylase